AVPRLCYPALACEWSARVRGGQGMRSEQWKARIMISPSEMYFASTPGIALKSNGCLRFHGCPTAGGGGRLICFTRPLAAPRIRPNPVVAESCSQAETLMDTALRNGGNDDVIVAVGRDSLPGRHL